jgi:hypothetical protein
VIWGTKKQLAMSLAINLHSQYKEMNTTIFINRSTNQSIQSSVGMRLASMDSDMDRLLKMKGIEKHFVFSFSKQPQKGREGNSPDQHTILKDHVLALTIQQEKCKMVN